MNLIDTVKHFIQQHRLLTKGDRIIVAVSGGPDSITLLNVLLTLRHDLGIRLSVAHVNHNLRKDSRQEERFVRNLSHQLHLPFYSISIRIPKGKKKSSLEELAREARLRFFIRLAKKQKASGIALGHTQDDLAETILMRILRGTGLLGLRGILPKREIAGVVFIRPLLGVRRRTVESFLRKKRLKFCRDTSNQRPEFFRNKIRLKLLPTLKKSYNPNIIEVLSHLAENVSVDYAYLERQAQRSWRKVISHAAKKTKAVHLNLRSFQKLDRSLQRMMIRQAIEKLKGDTRQFSFAHIRKIEELADHQTATTSIHLPADFRVFKTQKYLTLSRRNS